MCVKVLCITATAKLRKEEVTNRLIRHFKIYNAAVLDSVMLSMCACNVNGRGFDSKWKYFFLMNWMLQNIIHLIHCIFVLMPAAYT